MKEYGFIRPEIQPDNYVLGWSPMPFVITKPNGNWFKDRPTKELQKRGFETYNCTSFNTLAMIEAYMKGVFGLTVNYSDRWVGIIAGTKPPGNDPHIVCEAIREYGLIPEEMLPFSDEIKTVEEYYSFKGADKDACYAEAKKWKEKYDFMHEWIMVEDQTRDEQITNMRAALRTSPLAIAVYAWAEDERGVYIKAGRENHWTFQWGHEEFIKAEDSYEPTLKDIDQDINFGKRIYIRDRAAKPVKRSFWAWLLNLFN